MLILAKEFANIHPPNNFAVQPLNTESVTSKYEFESMNIAPPLDNKASFFINAVLSTRTKHEEKEYIPPALDIKESRRMRVVFCSIENTKPPE